MSNFDAFWNDTTFTVSEFLDFTNQLLSPIKANVQGEVTSVTPRGNTIFFSVCDSTASNSTLGTGTPSAKLECVVFGFQAKRFGFQLKPGMEVKLLGRPNIYKPSGKFSFIVDHASPVGEGALQLAFERLKRVLAETGFFDEARKQAVPLFCERIGLITSSQGDARHDFMKHLLPVGFSVQLLDARVEGMQAIDSLVGAIRWFNQQPQPVEVIVLTRGGGSLESLQAFNSEPLAQAIAASRIPVISGVGHERDVTIADLVADVRASTPTDAAKILSQPWRDARHFVELAPRNWQQQFSLALEKRRSKIRAVSFQLQKILETQLKTVKTSARRFLSILITWQHQATKTRTQLNNFKQEFTRNFLRALTLQQAQLNDQRHVLRRSLASSLNSARLKLEHADAQLDILNPENVLKRGFSITFTENGRLLRSIQQASQGETITTQLSDGFYTSNIALVSPQETTLKSEERKNHGN